MSAPAAWPLHRLRITTSRLDLRPVTDADIDALLALAQEGIHADDEMPFLRPWTDAEPEQLAWDFCRYFWGQRATWAPDEWRLPLAVRVTGGALVGVQQLQADRFAEIGAVDTSSWLARRHQGLEATAASSIASARAASTPRPRIHTPAATDTRVCSTRTPKEVRS